MSEGRDTVRRFLQDAGLSAYTQLLLYSGFENIEALDGISDGDLQDLGLPPQQAASVRRKISEMRLGNANQGLDQARQALANFLQQAGLSQYTDAFIRSGFDDLETLALIEDQDLKDLGILRGHWVKLKRKLSDHEAQKSQDVSASTCMLSHSNVPAQRSVETIGGHLQLTNQGVSWVVQSWKQVEDFGILNASERLYRHVFKLAPAAIGLFPPETRAKYRDWTAGEGDDEGENILESVALRQLFGKILNTVGNAVAGLHEMSKLVPMLIKLGLRHVNYGTAEPHWEVLGQALDLTLRDILGAAYTADVKKAWSMVYGFCSSLMIEGLKQARAERDAALETAASKASRIQKSKGSAESTCSTEVGSPSSLPLGQQGDPYMQAGLPSVQTHRRIRSDASASELTQ